MALTTGSAAAFTMTANQSIIKNTGTVIPNPTITAAIPGINTSLTIGAAAGQFNFAWIGSRAVTSGTPDDIDLTTTLSALEGTTDAFGDIVGLIISNPVGSGGNIVIGNAVSNAWSAFLGATGTATILPGATLALFAPIASAYTVDSTHKVLRVTASLGTITYTGWIVGH